MVCRPLRTTQRFPYAIVYVRFPEGHRRTHFWIPWRSAESAISRWPVAGISTIKTVTPGTIVEIEWLGAALAVVKEHQATYAPNRRRYDPARQRATTG
jgi:hypothetical protein